MNDIHNQVDDMILFSVDGSRAIEVTHGGFKFSDAVQPLFENGKCTEPIPVMVEGTYHIFDAAQKAWRKITITANDIREYFSNTPRDVAINYDHRRGGEAKGWLRLKDTGRVGTIATRSGERTALFASMELFEQATSDVLRGYFRDVSIELKPVSKEIIGNALTSYPIMRDTQFYSQVTDSLQDEEPVNDGTAVLEEGLEVEMSHENETNPEENQVQNQDTQAAIAEYLQQFGLTPEDMASLPGALSAIKQQEADVRLNAAKAKVQGLISRDGGKSVLAPGAIDAAAQLLAFCDDHAELNFSLDGETLNPAALLEKIFAGIEAVQVFGAVTDDGDVIANTHQDPPIPGATEPEKVDTDRVSGLVSRMKRQLGQ